MKISANDTHTLRSSERLIVDGADLTPGAHQDWLAVDLSLIRHCLKLTPTQRIEENESALELLRDVERSRHGAR